MGRIRYFLVLLALVVASLSHSADCPMEYKTTKYYGGQASCTAYLSTKITHGKFGSCVYSYNVPYTVTANVAETTSSTKWISQRITIADGGDCISGQFYPKIVTPIFNCIANLNVIRTETLPAGRNCPMVTNINIDGRSASDSTTPTDDIVQSVNVYNKSPIVELDWKNSSGKTRIQTRVKVSGVSSAWKTLSLESSASKNKSLNLEELIQSTGYLNSYPYDLFPYGTKNARVHVRMRTESYDGSAVSNWIYPKGASAYYNDYVDDPEYMMPNGWTWGQPTLTQVYTNSGTFRLVWPTLVWGELYMYSYITHNGKQIMLPWGKLDYLFRDLPSGQHVIQLTSCDEDPGDNETACMNNKTKLLITVQ